MTPALQKMQTKSLISTSLIKINHNKQEEVLLRCFQLQDSLQRER